jgi:hypothetical protein
LEKVPVIYVDMTENDAKLYSITDNRTSETSQWDIISLNDLIKGLDEMPDIDLPDSGFTTEELEEMVSGLDFVLPEEFPEYDESLANEVEYAECPECGHKFPK